MLKGMTISSFLSGFGSSVRIFSSSAQAVGGPEIQEREEGGFWVLGLGFGDYRV